MLPFGVDDPMLRLERGLRVDDPSPEEEEVDATMVGVEVGGARGRLVVVDELEGPAGSLAIMLPVASPKLVMTS